MTSPAIIMLDRADGAPCALPSGVATLGEADPFAAGREIAWTGAAALAAGRVNWSGAIEIGSFPHAETMIVTAGRLSLSIGGAPVADIACGGGVVVARGTALRLEAAPGTRWAFCATTGETSAVPGVTTLSADAALSPSAAPAPEVLLGPTPQCRSFNAYTDEAGRYRAGIWDSTPYHRASRPHRVNELMHILTGSVDLTDGDGTVTRVEQGDTVFVAHGAPCAWESRVHVAKFYVVQEVGG
jgi:uncharacterized cupin superfamily protein